MFIKVNGYIGKSRYQELSGEVFCFALVQNKFFIPTLLYLFKSTRYKTRGG